MIMSGKANSDLTIDDLEDAESHNILREYESGWGRIVRKSKDEPLVPAGIALTCFALIAATFGFRYGNQKYANSMLRLRVAAQGFTVLAAIGGSYYYAGERERQKQEARVKKAASRKADMERFKQLKE